MNHPQDVILLQVKALDACCLKSAHHLQCWLRNLASVLLSVQLNPLQDRIWHLQLNNMVLVGNLCQIHCLLIQILLPEMSPIARNFTTRKKTA